MIKPIKQNNDMKNNLLSCISTVVYGSSELYWG